MNEINSFKRTYQAILSPIGFAGGIYYSFKNKTGFWKGFGIAIIGSIALGGIGYGIDYARNKK